MSFAARRPRPDRAPSPPAAAARWWRIGLAVLACTLALAMSFPAAAVDRIAVHSAQLQWVDDNDGAVILDAQFSFELPLVLEDAVNRGIALYFVVEFELF